MVAFRLEESQQKGNWIGEDDVKRASPGNSETQSMDPMKVGFLRQDQFREILCRQILLEMVDFSHLAQPHTHQY